ncbi:hypothetical protein [Mucilaginibacter gotjawali]|uniref:Effector-binding domain-containing protein n=2 Tax=Mucilaginibacter gotjawali TaxID=1550579 RepID=A0A839SNK0_9SPHI|nr:hypothetical protein [Mucilaginibacter gotjawali]MBB3058794.1 effector-binding domain-containing protein [Mucilaginibacter gotjawali]BAU53827.1 hypothetical protein MgSA37_01998 [Mucilaginibacter gotjawali]
MNKKVLFPVLTVAIIAACFIPVTQQKSTLVKSPFLIIYSVLSNPFKWEQLAPGLKKVAVADSAKVSIENANASFRIKYPGIQINVQMKSGGFFVDEDINGQKASYSYILIPVADKFYNKTTVVSEEKTSAINYLIENIWPSASPGKHLALLKNFMENDSLHYGFKIFATGVPESNLIVMRKEVSKEKRFMEAAGMLTVLKQFVKDNNVKQMYPVIAQYLPKGKDSTQVNVGLYIDKEVSSGKEIIFTRMPKGGPLYAARFKGPFNKRNQAYLALRQYFMDHAYQTAIMPFETYFNDKLPVGDTDSVDMQVNFSTYPNDQPR